MSTQYEKSFAAFFGGDIDYVNDSVSALLVDTSVYTADFANDFRIDDIPEEAILSEAVVEGRFIDGLSLHADDVIFPSVDSEQEASAIIVFKDSDLIDETVLCFYFDDSASLPLTPSGADVTIAWPAEGLAVATIG